MNYLQGGFMIFPAKQQLESISLDDILQDSNPLLHQRLRVCRQVVGLAGGGDFEGVGPVRPRHPASILENNQALWLAVGVMLQKWQMCCHLMLCHVHIFLSGECTSIKMPLKTSCKNIKIPK